MGDTLILQNGIQFRENNGATWR